LLHDGRLRAGDVEQQGDMHLRSFGDLARRGLTSPGFLSGRKPAVTEIKILCRRGSRAGWHEKTHEVEGDPYL
jgi:hypothetical protein